MRLLWPVAVLLCLAQPGPALAACYDRNERGVQRRFLLKGDEAFDTRTGLTWKRCSLGTAWDGRRGCRGEAQSIGLGEAIREAKDAGAGWRVPSGPELQMLIDTSCGRPVVDRSVFPDIRPDEEGAADYWTTNAVGMADLYYYFNFMTGAADGHSRGHRLAVRLVRIGT